MGKGLTLARVDAGLPGNGLRAALLTLVFLESTGLRQIQNVMSALSAAWNRPHTGHALALLHQNGLGN